MLTPLLPTLVHFYPNEVLLASPDGCYLPLLSQDVEGQGQLGTQVLIEVGARCKTVP